MTDIKLLPLPKVQRVACTGGSYPMSNSDDGDYVDYDDHVAAMSDYARANVAHAIAAQDAEIERLRAEWLKALGLSMQAQAEAKALRAERDSFQRVGIAAHARAERLAEEIDNRWAQGVHTCHDKCQRTACVLRRDNERLAEAINAYKSECDNPAKDYVLRAKRRDEMFALLRDQGPTNDR